MRKAIIAVVSIFMVAGLIAVAHMVDVVGIIKAMHGG
jgi:hypothetical protein